MHHLFLWLTRARVRLSGIAESKRPIKLSSFFLKVNY